MRAILYLAVAALIAVGAAFDEPTPPADDPPAAVPADGGPQPR